MINQIFHYILAKLLSTLFFLFFIIGCTTNEKQLSSSCIFIKSSDDNFSLKVNFGSTTKTYERIERIGWTENSVLILHPKDNYLGWTYIFDAGDVTVKEWGHYSENEFAKRRRELDISSYETFASLIAWNKK